MSINMEAWKEKLDTVKRKYGFSFDLKHEQDQTISEIMNGNDVYGQLPTGFGKSLIFTLIPLLFDEMCEKTNTALVISPLKALMQDQVKNLRVHNIKAVAITEDLSPSDLKASGPVSLLLASPEAANLPKWRSTIKKLKDNICVLVFDEAHCISQWGLDFRPDYRSVSTIQSLLSVPTLVLTATSTVEIQKDIYEVLGMTEETTRVVASLPNRPNIYLEMTLCQDKFQTVLDWLPPHLMQTFEKLQKTILYVRSINVCHQIFSWLLEEVGEYAFDGRPLPGNRVVEMFHANTDTSSKDRIMEDFTSQEGKIRLLISTVAFGMGVDIRNVDLVVHWSLPPSSLSYWQEIGRCARDGRRGYAICFAFKRSVTKCPDKDLQMLAENMDKTGVCLRNGILKKFQLKGISDAALSSVVPTEDECLHDRCDNQCFCAKCECCVQCQRTCKCPRKSTDTLKDFLSHV